MKVGLVTPYDVSIPGGVRTHVMGLGHELQRRGFDVIVLGPSSRACETLAGIRFIRVGRPVPIRTAGSIARLAINPLLGFSTWRILRRERFDLLHLHEPLVPMAPFWCLALFGGPKVGTFHLARDRPNQLYRLARWVLRPFAARLGARIAVSESARDTVAAFLPGDYAVIPNGLEPSAYILRAGSGRAPTVLFIGRMERRKGVFEAVRAIAEVRDEQPGANLILVGDGPMLGQAKQLAHELGAPCEFRGSLPLAQLRELYASATVFCAPSLENESFGLVLLEAMAAALPVVASDLPGYRGLLDDGRAGVLVPPGDAESLARALCRLLADAVAREQLASAGRGRAEQFGWPVLAGQVIEQYRLAGAPYVAPTLEGAAR